MMRFGFPCLCLIALTFGCGPKPAETIPVSGLVTLDGQPLSGANVIFVPQGETKGNGGLGTTNADGRFEARLNDNRSDKGQLGLFAGSYKVLVSKMVNPDGTPFVASEDVAPIDSNAKELLPEKFSHYEQTMLSADITPDMKPLTFDLRSK
jgi:hypothetical protein